MEWPSPTSSIPCSNGSISGYGSLMVHTLVRDGLVLLDDRVKAALRHVRLELLVDGGIQARILVRGQQLLPGGVRVLLEGRRPLPLPRREVRREEQRAHVQPLLEVLHRVLGRQE